MPEAASKGAHDQTGYNKTQRILPTYNTHEMQNTCADILHVAPSQSRSAYWYCLMPQLATYVAKRLDSTRISSIGPRPGVNASNTVRLSSTTIACNLWLRYNPICAVARVLWELIDWSIHTHISKHCTGRFLEYWDNET